MKKHNLFVDSTELQCLSQSSLTDSRTPPCSAPSSPAKEQSAVAAQKAEQVSSSIMIKHDISERQPVEKKQEFAGESSQTVNAQPSKASKLATVPSIPSCISTDSTDLSKVPSITVSESSDQTCEISADSTVQSQAKIATVISPVIIVSEPESLSDQTISVNIPVEVNTESSVHPASIKENQSVSVSEKTEVDMVSQSEICDVAPAPPEELHSGTVQSDTTNAKIPSLSQPKGTDDTQVQMLSCDSSPLNVGTTASESAAESMMESSTTTNTNGLPVIPDLLAGGDMTEQSKVEPEGTTDSHQDTFTEDQEAKDPLDSVKSIRDLVVEIIEVEDVVRSCADSRGTPPY